MEINSFGYLPFLFRRPQLKAASNLRAIRKKMSSQSSNKLAKAKFFRPLSNVGIIQKIAKLRKRFSEYRLLEVEGICRRAYCFARNDFLPRSIFYWRQRKKSKTASFDFYFKLVVRIPVPRQVLGLFGSRKKRRICAH